ncbi:MAG: right-handed parallel beta-helix repeat-containing protein [Gemmatimonadetes bacterium]|nr:right-handed parallel beta-helix repeat-containing protein [Gemmatimonadota bacterium]
MKFGFGTFLTALLALSSGGPATATTYFLSPDGTGDFPTIAAAITAAVDGDVIVLSDGVYSGGGNSSPQSTKEIELRSANGPGMCEIHGTSTWRGTLDGLTFVNPPVPLAIRSGTIRNCVIVGGGEGGLETRYDCVVENVTVRDGGQPAIACFWGFPTLTGCTIESNAPTNTTGPGTLTLARTNATIEDCRIAGNRAYRAGGINGYVSTAVIRGCTIVGNEGKDAGGVRLGRNSQATIEQSTIANNRGDDTDSADGAFVHDAGSLTLSRSIVWSGCGNSVFAVGSGTVDVTCSDVSPITDPGSGTITLAADVISLDPLFCAPEDCLNTPTGGGIYALDVGSPAVAQTCGAMGSLGVVCGTGVEELESMPWSRLKTLHR